MPDNVVPLHSNFPPDPLDAQALRDRLGVDYAALARRFVELEQGAGRIPKIVEDDGAAQRVVDFVAQQCRPLVDEAKTAHRREKAPYLAAGRIIDEFFLRRIDKFALAVARVTEIAEAYHRKKLAAAREAERREREAAERVRRQAEAEAQRLAAEAARKSAAGERAQAVDLGRQAQKAEEKMTEAAALLAAPAAPVRLHGDYGAVGFSAEKWTYEVEDPTRVPLGFLTIDDAAVRAAIAEGVRDIPGIRIFAEDRFTIRRC